MSVETNAFNYRNPGCSAENLKCKGWTEIDATWIWLQLSEYVNPRAINHNLLAEKSQGTRQKSHECEPISGSQPFHIRLHSFLLLQRAPPVRRKSLPSFKILRLLLRYDIRYLDFSISRCCGFYLQGHGISRPLPAPLHLNPPGSSELFATPISSSVYSSISVTFVFAKFTASSPLFDVWHVWRESPLSRGALYSLHRIGLDTSWWWSCSIGSSFIVSFFVYLFPFDITFRPNLLRYLRNYDRLCSANSSSKDSLSFESCVCSDYLHTNSCSGVVRIFQQGGGGSRESEATERGRGSGAGGPPPPPPTVGGFLKVAFCCTLNVIIGLDYV